MKQKVTKYLIALAMALIPALTFAQTAIVNGITWSYTLDASNKATITGASPAPTGPLTIPGTLNGFAVISITGGSNTAKNGIVNNTAITSLTLPPSLTSIGPYAFWGCTGLMGQLTIPAGVTRIDRGAFAYCSGLTGTLTIPAGVTFIGNSTFYACGFTGDLIIPSNVVTIDNSAFNRCSELRSVTVKSPMLNMNTKEGEAIFTFCTNLEYIDVSAVTTPKFVSSLSRRDNVAGCAFRDTPAHTVIYLPSSIDPSLISSLSAEDNVNYVLNGKCDWFYVQDGCDYYIPKAFTATKATWNAVGTTGNETTPFATRTNFGKLVTAYLPFDFMLPATSGLQGFTMLDKKNDPEHVFRFKQQAATVPFKANTPYILMNVSGAAIAFPEATNITVPQTPISRVRYAADGITTSYDGGVSAVDNTAGGTISDPVKGTWGFYGTTEAVSNNNATAWKALILSGGAWYDLRTDVASPLSPLRAFLATNDGAVGSKPSFTLEDLNGNLIGGTTGIDEIDNNEPANSVETRIYNLNGQYLGKDLNNLPKGLYIVNGKKTIKK